MTSARPARLLSPAMSAAGVHRRSGATRGFAGLALTFALLLSAPQMLQAATITVNSLADPNGRFTNDGRCTLREAIINANNDAASSPTAGECVAGSGVDTIVFDPALTASGPAVSDLLNNGETITQELLILGPGSDRLTINGFVSNTHLRPFNATAPLTISGLTISGGGTGTYSDHYAAPGSGGGIQAMSNLTLTDVVVTNNTVASNGGVGGGIAVIGGTLSMTRCTVSNNAAIASGGNGGGIFVSGGRATVIDSTISGNRSFFNGGGAYLEAGADISGSTITGNQATGESLNARGGGLLLAGSSQTYSIRNSSIAHNSTGPQDQNPGGGIAIGGGGTLTMDNSTVDANGTFGFLGHGGGIALLDTGRGTTAIIRNSTISNNFTGNLGGAQANGGGIYVTSGGNLTLINSTVANNDTAAQGSSTSRGGGLYFIGSSLSISNSSFVNNTSGYSNDYGRNTTNALYVVSAATATLNNNLFVQTGTSNVPGTVDSTEYAFNGDDFADDPMAGAGSSFIDAGGNNYATDDQARPRGFVTAASASDILGTATPLLADNGGPTKTIALGTGALAIDAGNSAVCADATGVNGLDQRAASRDAHCDLGAFEFGAEAPDTTPDAFAFSPASVSNVAPSSAQTSSTITVAGINRSVPVTVTGGEYSIGCSGSFTSAAGSIGNGGTVCVRHTSSASFSTSRTTTLSIGGVSASFASTTAAEDATPDAFSFSPATVSDVAPGSLQTSSSVMATGINTSVAVTVSGGSYGKNGAACTATAATTAVSGDRFVVCHLASSSFSSTTTTTLSMGGVSSDFASTTAAEDNTPEAFAFTPASVSNAPRSSTQTSSEITVAGINTTVAVSISGGMYAKNGAACTASAAGTAVAGDRFKVCHVSSGAFASTVTTTLGVGGVSASFSSTTPSEDITPDAFSFSPASLGGVARNSTQTSSEIAVSGINSAAPVAVSNGLYALNGGPCTNSSGTVMNTDRVRLCQQAAASFATSKVTTLTIGANGVLAGVSSSFTTITQNDDTLAAGTSTSSTRSTVPDSGGMAVIVETPAGGSASISALRRISAPAGLPAGMSFPNGFFAIDVSGLPSGVSTATVTITLPAGATPTGYLKCTNASPSVCRLFPGAVIRGNVITLTLTDNDAYDFDPAVGRISDPGAPVMSASSTPPAPTGAHGGGSFSPFAGLLLGLLALGKRSLRRRWSDWALRA